MTVRGRDSRGDSLARTGLVSACAVCEEGSLASTGHEETYKTACILLIMLALMCVPAQAQLNRLADERGNLVFIYEGPAAPSVTNVAAKPDPAVSGAESAATPAAAKPVSPGL